MRLVKKLGLATAVALVAVGGVAGAASATTIDPSITPFTLTSTNTTFSLPGGPISFSCHSVLTGTTPFMGSGTWGTFTATPTYDNCLSGGFVPVTVTPNDFCMTVGTRPIFHVMGNSLATAAITMTLPAACSIDIFVSVVNCTWTITGGQALGNGTTGNGGGDWTNLGTHSTAHFETVVVPTVDSAGGMPQCGSQGVHGGTLSGDYTVAGATNVTVTPF